MLFTHRFLFIPSKHKPGALIPIAGTTKTTLKFHMMEYKPKPLTIYPIKNKTVATKSTITQNEDFYVVWCCACVHKRESKHSSSLWECEICTKKCFSKTQTHIFSPCTPSVCVCVLTHSQTLEEKTLRRKPSSTTYSNEESFAPNIFPIVRPWKHLTTTRK